jgi:hypothetical protein
LYIEDIEYQARQRQKYFQSIKPVAKPIVKCGHPVPLEFSPKKSEETRIRVKGELGTGWVQATQTIDKDQEDIDALDKFPKDHREN